MTKPTVFNLTEQPVQYTVDGNRVPGRTAVEVTDKSDPYYVAALERGDLVVLSDAVAAEAVAQPVTEPEPEPVEETLAAEGDTTVDELAEPESKKKQPNKAKEN